MTQAVEFVEEVCGIYFRSVLLDQQWDLVEQHRHDHDHATYVGAGSVRMWIDGTPVGDFKAGQAIAIVAGKAHAFQALEPNTRLACVHDVKSAESVKVKGV